MKDIPIEVLWYGKNESLPKSTVLKAGKLELTYESGIIRNIKLGDHELVRMIYVSVRDHNWATVIPTIRNEQIEEKEGGFTISYQSLFNQDDIQIDFKVRISGTDENTIVFDIEGEALSDFQTNRTGFCLLHPIKECIGKTGEVVSPDGKIESFFFPELISPDQPVKNISEMSWELAGLGKAAIKFEGEVFEMEDQRNWTDDSYKTYCRPLALHFPYTLQKGRKVSQRISLSVRTDHELDSNSSNNYHLMYDESDVGEVPSIGIRRTPQGRALEKDDLHILGKVNFDFYEVYIDFSAAWEEELKNAIVEAESLGFPVKLLVHFNADYQEKIEQLAGIFSHSDVLVGAVLVLRGPNDRDFEGFIDKVSHKLRSAFPGVKIGAGTKGYFADLNGNRINNRRLDFISYALNPQVHAFDNQTLVENLAGQSATVRSAKAFAKGKEIHVSTVTFKMQNVNAEEKERDKMPVQIDPRQMSLFGAAWTLGSVKQLSEAGVGAITYFEAVGEKGIIMGNRSSRYPLEFMVDKGAVYPIYYLLKEILKKSNAQLVRSISSHPRVFEGMVLTSDHKKTIILVNFSPEQINVQVDGIAHDARVKKLDEKSVTRALYDHEKYEASPYCEFQFEAQITTFKIRPFGIVFVNE